jgi:hypothetical protein
VLVAAVAALSAAPSALAKPKAADVIRVSSDPYSGDGAQHATEVEPDSFATDSTVVSAFQVGRRVSPGGASNIGWATSHGAGKAFEHGFLPGITQVAGGPYVLVSDPSVAYDAAHRTWLISSLTGFGTPVSFGEEQIVASRSPDGTHWSDPVTIAHEDAGGLDKNWTVCDNHPQSPFFGHCYTTFDDSFTGFRLEVSTSTDGGRTWGPAVETEGSGTGFGAQPVVQPDGTVVAPFLGPGPFSVFNYFIGSFRSTDGGESWSAPVTVSEITWHLPPGMRAAPAPSAEIDRAGNVYVVWHDCRFRAGCSANDIVLSKSADGVHWTTPTRIPIDSVDSGADHFIPGLAVDPHTAGAHARLALTYYDYPHADCTAATCELTVGFISSRDGGATWGEPRGLAGPMPIDWFPNTTLGRMVGDYISTSFMHEHAFPFFAEANPPSGGSFDEAIATVAGGLHVNQGQIASAGK